MTSVDLTVKSRDDALSPTDKEAIRFFRIASDKELAGLMSEAIAYYRKAYKLNEKVDKLYRDEDVPIAALKLQLARGKNSLVRIDENLVRLLDVTSLLNSFAGCDALAPDPHDPNQVDLNMLSIKFANASLNGQDLPDSVKPVSPLVNLLSDVWLKILLHTLLLLPEAWFNFSITCKKHAYLGFALSQIWRLYSYLTYPKQNYAENIQYLETLPDEDEEYEISLPIPLDPKFLVPQYDYSWKSMIRERPFIKFLGCYISVVNYYSEGINASLSSSWLSPVHIVTYYRYIRFYPDGSCIKVLTTLEPTKVVPHLLRRNTLRSIAAVIDELGIVHNKSHARDSHQIFHGKWTINAGGEVHISIENGLVPYCVFHYNFIIKNVGGIHLHNKLAWVNYYTVRKKMFPEDDREGEVCELAIGQEKLFKFLRVKSYTLDN